MGDEDILGNLHHDVHKLVGLGGGQMRLGDYVVLEGDGIVVVPWERAREVLHRARERIEREAQL